MLTLDEFNGLGENEKAAAVWEGSFLADREENGLRIKLYGLTQFYVEVFYDPLANQIIRLEAFAAKNLLVPYLAQLKLNG